MLLQTEFRVGVLFSLSHTANLTKESRQGIVPKLSSEVTEMSLNENLGVVAENNVRSLVGKNRGNPCLNSDGPVGINSAERVSTETRKTMAFREALKSIEYAYFKDKKLSGHIENNISALSDMLILKSKIPSRRKRKLNSLVDGEGLVSACGSDLGVGSHISRKKRNVLQKQNPILQPCNKSDGLNESPDMITDSGNGVELFTRSMSLVNCSKEVAQVCQERAADSVKCNQENQFFLEDMVSDNYMKLLELDNAADEERFRIAVEMPLSPSLPEIGMPDHEICWITQLRNQSEVPNEVNLVASGCSSDNMEMDISQTRLGHCLDANADTQITKGLLDCGNKGMIVSCTVCHNPTLESIVKYCIVLTNAEDRISEIISTMETCIFQSGMVLSKDWVMDKIILALSKQQDLLPTERACVFLSLLLHNFSVVSLLKSDDLLTSKHSPLSDSFAMHVNKVMSDGDVARLLLDLCLLDDLFHIIENFLIDRRVLMYGNRSHDKNVLSDSGSVIFLRDDTAVYISMVTATVDQLVAGSIILASTCSAFGRIGFVCEASYRILQTNTFGSCLPSTLLHIFASLCGEKYFIMNEYSLIMTAVKAIVVFLEREDKAGCPCPGTLSTTENHECVFSKDAVSLDEVTGLLLEKLQLYAVPGSRPEFFGTLSSSECSTSHYTGTHVSDSNSVASKSYTEFGDILSLLELVACYMSWDRTWSKIISPLLKLLDSCACEKFLAGLIVLLGQIWRKYPPNVQWLVVWAPLGRIEYESGTQAGSIPHLETLATEIREKHGVDSCGNLPVGAEELRQKLFSLLDQNPRKWSMSAQSAIVQALIAFDKIDFEELIQREDLQAATNQSDHCNLIRTWFFKLGAEQKSLLASFFQTADLRER
ncbi:hypothetical protein Scep_011681 [Stephania cephalantha]|uniref:Uncharacterized protein n=1 Tax=Stephania cephalantha TaxID=152367 RepID=A0AAP0JFL1_9MAGN